MPSLDGYRLDERLGLERPQAAAYVNASERLFDQMVADGRMPQPRQMNTKIVWDRDELTMAFKALPHREPESKAMPPGNPWDTKSLRAV
jgi:predicted DNA-binding transcriptional regulator AlpA